MDEAQSYNFLEALKGLVASGKYDKAIQGCKALLQQVPGHPGAIELLAEAERRKATFQQTSGAPLQARQINCPSCGKTVAPHLDTSQSITCPNCQTVINLGGEAPTGVEGRHPVYIAPKSFLKLGLEGMLQGKKVQIIGRLHYNARIREWDTEDNDWWTGDWNWDEWVVVTESKEYLFLEEDDEGYKLHQKFTPQKPNIPDRNARAVSLDDSGIRYNVLEHGTATLSFFEGEFTWLPQVGDQLSYCDTDGPDGTYSIEWASEPAEGRGMDVTEVEFFSGAPIDKMTLLYAFGQRELVEKEKQSRAAQLEYNRWANLAFLTAGLLTVAGCGSCQTNGKQIYQHSEAYAMIPDTGVTVGPFTLDKPGEIYQIKLRGSIPDNTESWAGVELLDAAEDSINTAEGDLWRESGTDDEGAWSESDLESNMYFRLDKAGTYYARMFVEAGNIGSGTLSIEVLEGLTLSRYYFIGALLAAGLGASLRKFKSANPIWILFGVLILGFMILKKMPVDDD